MLLMPSHRIVDETARAVFIDLNRSEADGAAEGRLDRDGLLGGVPKGPSYASAQRVYAAPSLARGRT